MWQYKWKKPLEIVGKKRVAWNDVFHCPSVNMKPKITVSARAQLTASAAKWLIPPAPTEDWWNQQWERIMSSLQLDQKPWHKWGVSRRRDARRSSVPYWTGHTDLERGFVLPQSSPSTSSLNTRRCKKQKCVLHNTTEPFRLLLLTKLNQYKKQYKQTNIP